MLNTYCVTIKEGARVETITIIASGFSQMFQQTADTPRVISFYREVMRPDVTPFGDGQNYPYRTEIALLSDVYRIMLVETEEM